MDPIAASQPSVPSAKKPLPSPLPIHPPRASPASGADQIWTPEKPAQLPRRARSRNVAFSLKEVKQAALGLRTLKELPAEADPHESDDVLSSVARELGSRSGTDQSLDPFKAKPQIKLPEKYEMLCEFFNSMESSIRLLRLKGAMATFPNVCTSIQHLTERRFTYAHLAQLRYLLPEAILIKKVLLRDESTSCMKPEIQVTLQVEGIGDNKKLKGESQFLILRKLFRQRLVDFLEEHPEGDDIPEDQLPHPFNQAKPSIPPNPPRAINCSTSIELSSNASQQQSVVLSHMSQSFQRRFSTKLLVADSDKAPLTCKNGVSVREDSQVFAGSSLKECVTKPTIKKSLPSSLNSSGTLSIRAHRTEPEKSTKSDNCPSPISDVLAGTPAKHVSTPARLMIATPDLQTPKRYCPEVDYASPPPKKSAKRSTRTKLFTTPTKSTEGNNKEMQHGSSLSADDDGVLNFLPKSLLQSVRDKERNVSAEREAGVSDAVRRAKLIACLPTTFDVILLIYQSIKRSVMTKQELIHKIIASTLKVVDRGEVEEQLNLFFELVPDWIFEKISSSGDILCCVNVISSPEEIRRRLTEAL